MAPHPLTDELGVRVNPLAWGSAGCGGAAETQPRSRSLGLLGPQPHLLVVLCLQDTGHVVCRGTAGRGCGRLRLATPGSLLSRVALARLGEPNCCWLRSEPLAHGSGPPCPTSAPVASPGH